MSSKKLREDLIAERDAALAKLERVREWADENTIEADFRARKLYAILDAVPVQEERRETPFDSYVKARLETSPEARKAYEEMKRELATERDYDVKLCECGCGQVSPTDCPSDIAWQKTAEDSPWEIIEREVVLTSYQLATASEPRLTVWDLLDYETGMPDGRELARATVTFKVPRKAEVKRGLAERLQMHIGVDGELYIDKSLTEELMSQVRAMESKVTK